MATSADTIKTNSQSPQSASGDGQSMQQVPIPDQIMADRYAASKAAMAKTGRRGIRFQKISFPGAR